MNNLENIKKFIESCYNERSKNFPIVWWTNYQNIIDIIIQFNKYFKFSEHHGIIMDQFKIVNFKTAELLRNHKYHESLQIFDNFDINISYLYEKKLISDLDYFVYQAKRILALTYHGIILESVSQAKDIFQLAEKNKNSLQKYFQTERSQSENTYFMDYFEFLSFLKSLAKHVNRSCIQHSAQKLAGFFHIKSKDLEYQQLKIGFLENFISEEIIIKPDVPRYGNPIITVYTMPKYKGWKAVKNCIIRILNIFRNRFSRFIWDYGESIPKLLRFSVLVILFYTLGLQLSKLKIIDSSNQNLVNGIVNHIYFNLVTFTSLGYGDFRPADEISRLFFSIEALLGLILISMCIFIIGKKANN